MTCEHGMHQRHEITTHRTYGGEVIGTGKWCPGPTLELHEIQGRAQDACYWRSHGPTMRELYKRAELIAAAFGCSYTMPYDRATVILNRNGKPGGEFNLMTDDERADGHWVHSDPHAGECPDRVNEGHPAFQEWDAE
jgi:hypothetical protein